MRQPLKSLLALTAIAGLAGACTESPITAPPLVIAEGLAVRVLAGALPAGSLGTFVAENSTESGALTGPCHLYFERWNGTSWTAATTSDRVCAEVLYRVDANASLERPFAMPANTPPGTYRLAVDFWRDGESHTVRANSNEFDIQ